MPLFKGSSNSIISANIAELRKSGKPEKEATAAALSQAGKFKAGKEKRLSKGIVSNPKKMPIKVK